VQGAARYSAFDGAADYKSPDFVDPAQGRRAEGIDVYVDNVGGDVTLAVLPLLNRNSRMPMCGYIAYYGVAWKDRGPTTCPRSIARSWPRAWRSRASPG
jgi:NADPH-dependent curcumin reductase CurA